MDQFLESYIFFRTESMQMNRSLTSREMETVIKNLLRNSIQYKTT